jgi:hypothetical protein
MNKQLNLLLLNLLHSSRFLYKMPINNLPIEIWAKVCEHISSKEIWKIRLSLNSNFLRAVRLTLHRNLMGISGKRPQIILKVLQNCNGNQAKFILVPDVAASTDFYVTFTPLDVGFQGLGRLLSKIIEPLLSDRVNACHGHDQDFQCEGEVKPFARQDFQKLTTFFKSRWNDLKTKLPHQIQSAYSVLFGHILNTLETLCDRPQEFMDISLQMSVLVQTWRVIDILSSPGLRDPQIGCQCRQGKSCFSEMSFIFERDFGDGHEETRPLEFDVSDFGGVVDDLAWEWDQNNVSLKAISAEFCGPNAIWDYPAHFKIYALRRGSDGFKNSLSLSDATLKIPIALLFGK